MLQARRITYSDPLSEVVDFARWREPAASWAVRFALAPGACIHTRLYFNGAMAWASLGLSILFGVLAVGVRSWLQIRRRGRSPIRSGAGVSGFLALGALSLVFIAGPLADVVLDERGLIHSGWFGGFGLGLSAVGLAAVLWSQAAMGDSLRIGVDPHERTALVTTGPFRWVRNPIYTAMFMYVLGVAAVAPNVISLVVFGVFVIAVDLHVRIVEEPYLANVHGSSYREYTERVGRFVPLLGKIARPKL